MNAPSPPPSATRPRLLVVEAWGIGDVALAIPFLREATLHADVTLLAPPHAAPLLRRFAPGVRLIEAVLPWTVFRGKYHLHRWPWSFLRRLVRHLRAASFNLAVSARPDPRDHILLFLAGTPRRLGFPRVGSRSLLTDALSPPASPHRAAAWAALASALGWPPPIAPRVATRRMADPPRAVIRTGAGQAVREWPRQRYGEIAARLRIAGWAAQVIDEHYDSLDRLMEVLATADLFIGNDSGPGHLAALLGVPTFTVFGPQVPEAFHPAHPAARWIEGAPCPHRPCFDACRFARPHCIQDLTTDEVWAALQPSLCAAAATSAPTG